MWSWEAWLIVGAVAGALVLARLWRAAEARVEGLQAEVESVRESAEQLETKLSRESSTRQRQADELAGLRKKADKAKRRQAKTPEQPLGTVARIRDHEAQVDRLESERNRVSVERDALAEQVSRLEARLEVAAQELAAATAGPEPKADEADGELEQLRAALAESRERASKLSEELDVRRVTEARLRKRMENQEQLYASIRAELDAKKDRLRTQEEQLQRLQALKVAVLD